MSGLSDGSDGRPLRGKENDMTKFDFCSKEWIALAREYLLGQSEGADLAGVEVAFNEVFTHPPAHLDPDGAGKIGWFVRVADDRVEVGAGVLPSADLRVFCDYETVLPAARRLSTDPPLDDATRQALVNSVTREGDPSAMEGLTLMAGLHDAMAVRTR